ncbi:MAG: AAA family ATPase [Synergistaceae bacterium]|jgi:uncharacterized protein YPO0396|nr:AAA family ATPase [Synergistaceae bacterium]
MARQLEFDFVVEDVAESVSGFRLRRFELYNWGTFNAQIWSLPLDGKNGLLTGDNGSGKSTFMDALTTLLVPSNKAAYNKAAGAETRERTLRSYVEGYYRSERLEDRTTARPVALRESGSYSVLLGCFHNEALDQAVTLAQVFWMRENESQPDRFYVVVNREMSIKEHFSSFGAEMKNLRGRLKDIGAEVFDSFIQYRARFSRALGIPAERSEHALELFHQAVSMKSIGDLTDFVRTHMLEPIDSSEKIRELIRRFDDLMNAHNSILTAKRQVGLLEPIVENCGRYKTLTENIETLAACLSAVEVYFAVHKTRLLSKRIEELIREEERLSERLMKLAAQKTGKETIAGDLGITIAGLGGDRIEAIKLRINDRNKERDRRYGEYVSYSGLLKSLGLPEYTGMDSFLETRNAIAAMTLDIDDRLTSNENAAVEFRVNIESVSKELENIKNELRNLRANRTNISAKHTAIRSRMSEELGIPASDLPFAGELLRVRPEAYEWEGAAERILHNFGMSVLIPDAHYTAVSNWVNDNHIGGRLVYYRVKQNRARPLDAGLAQISRNSLVNKIETKPGNKFEGWLLGELTARFNYACCDDMESFRGERRAVTRTGQVKTNDMMHEKDDRFYIEDRSRYVLGWENQSKIDVLENSSRILESRLKKLTEEQSALSVKSKETHSRRSDITRLGMFRDFASIDWNQPAEEIEGLKHELEAFLAASGRLNELNAQLDIVKNEIHEIEASISRTTGEIGTKKGARQEKQYQLEELRPYLNSESLERHSPLFEKLDEFSSSMFAEYGLTLENCDKNERISRDRLNREKDSESGKAEDVATKTVSMMTAFRGEYVMETQEFDDTMRSAPDYARFLNRLKSDDLPRFESRFKELLHKNTINEIATFQAQLYGKSQEISERIEIINRSLAGIDYNQGRYIKLEAHRVIDTTIRGFQEMLRACTEDTITGSENLYSEEKFQNVRNIIGKFKGRPDKTIEDARWTAFVTDVRNWFSFTVSEIWRESGTEYDTSASSTGKSGGQKEKLAYTILAASLAYQFGLTDDISNPKTFRFVMIDEAFGRGSDESAQFALTLFKKLNLQLLIATPMQKIHVIEQFVSRVAFVRNESGSDSKLTCMTIEEHQEKKNASGIVDRA